MTRQCTKDHKISPIRKKLRELGATKKNPAIMAIGFSIDESIRMNDNPKYQVQYIKKEYPLIDDRISREGCKKIIKDYGWELPIKSGCYYCPFRSKKQMRELYANHPDLFEKTLQMEMNDRKYPNHLPFGTPLITIKQNQSLSSWLDDEPDQSCSEGHCMT